MAKISVLMAVYNVEAYVAEALASIQSQTFTDMEIVVVDDGSTDRTLHIIEQAASSDSRIKTVRTPRNQGLPLALNYGLEFCHTPYIARMDGDDIALPTRLEKQFRFLEDHLEIALIGCATSAINELGQPIPGLGVSMKPITQEAIARTIFMASPCSHVWLARREVYDKLFGYREIGVAEDYDFLLRALTSGFRITNLSEPLMLIRTRSGNISSRLEQRKAHYYIADLYRERMRNGQDSFSQEGYEHAVKCCRLENGVFQIAMKCVHRGLLSHNRVIRYLLLALSALVSPWQARYFILRLRLKMALQTPGF